MRKNPRAKNNSTLSHSTSAIVETIERRLLLSGAVFSGNTLTVTGSSAADAIDVDYNNGSGSGPFDITATINGTQQSFNNEPLQKVVINSGDGNDTLSVEEPDGDGSDAAAVAVSVTAGGGNDNITTSIANQNAGASLTIVTGNGNDSVTAISSGHATITGGSGSDTYDVESSYAEYPVYATVYGGNGNDTITAGAGGNAFVTAYGQGGNNTFAIKDYDDSLAAYGGSGVNTLDLTEYDTAESTKLIALDGQPHGNLTLTDIQNVQAAFDGNLTVLTNSTTNDDIEVADDEGIVSLVGGGGNDTLNAGPGADINFTGATAYLQGGSGTSLLIPGIGVTHFSNGTGQATADFANTTADLNILLSGDETSGDPSASAYDYVNNYQVSGPFDTFDGTVQNAIAGSGNDLLQGTGGNNILTGGSGNDTLEGDGGTDALFGGGGNDTFDARDGSYTYIDGGSGTNTAYTDAFDTTYNVQSRNPDLAAPVQFTGTVIGTTGSFTNAGNTIAKVFDGNVNTLFDAPTAGGSYVGLDLGTPQVVNQISFAPRAGWESRMNGGVIQGSNNANFASATTLYTVNFIPASGALTTVGFANNTAYRYYRYVGPANSYCNIAELKLFNTTQPFIAEDSSGNLVINGTGGSDNIGVSFETDVENTFDVGATFTYTVENFNINLNGYIENLRNNSIRQIIINSGDGNDTVSVNGYADNDFSQTTLPLVNLMINAGNGNDSINTTLGHNDEGTITNGDSVTITAGNGNDNILAMGGANQTIIAGDGNDSLQSGATNGLTKALIQAGNGNDTLIAGSPGDSGDSVTVFAGSGQDSFQNSDVDDSMTANNAVISYITTTLTGTVAGIPTSPGDEALVTVHNTEDGADTSNDLTQLVPIGGNYDFSDITIAGDSGGGFYPIFLVTVTPPTGYIVTQPATGNSYSESGDLVTGYNFLLTPTTIHLTGTVVGTAGSFNNQGNTGTKAFDGNLSTYFDATTATGNWVGLNLGSPQIITQISYAPRSGWSSRMVGGMFQGSNSPTFSQGVVTLYTVASTPATGVLTTIAISNPNQFQYVRYLGPANSYCNIAEAQFFGHAPTAPAPFVGTAVGTPGSYKNQGNVIANVFDGNLSTFFNAPAANGDWVGLDLGSPKVVDQVEFAPRAGWANRMVGGEIQASNSADFSTGVVTLYTITAAPTAGVLATASFTNATAYRYYRYIGPDDSYCNIAELDFEG